MQQNVASFLGFTFLGEVDNSQLKKTFNGLIQD